MKKFGIIFVVALVVFGLVGCGSSGGKKAAGDSPDPFFVDLSTLTVTDLDGNPIGEGGVVKNPVAFTKNYDDMMILFNFPAGFDITAYSRITVKVDVFNADGGVIPPADTNAMVSLIYDIKGDIRGPDMGPGKNTPLKEFNVGGGSSSISRARGFPVRLSQNPQAILFQNSNIGVKFIEVKEICFHDSNYPE
jgi:hypothetical protein